MIRKFSFPLVQVVKTFIRMTCLRYSEPFPSLLRHLRAKQGSLLSFSPINAAVIREVREGSAYDSITGEQKASSGTLCSVVSGNLL